MSAVQRKAAHATTLARISPLPYTDKCGDVTGPFWRRHPDATIVIVLLVLGVLIGLAFLFRAGVLRRRR